MRIFKHLQWNDRLRIEKMLRDGMKPRQISEVLRVSRQTIYRELKRGQYERLDGSTWTYSTAYSPDIAERRYQENLRAKGPALKIGKDFDLMNYIEDKIIHESCSPAAALGYAKIEGRTFKTSVSVQTLYSYIKKGVFLTITNEDLPNRGRHKRKYKKIRRAAAPTRGESIDRRPEIIDRRQEFGHWEGDTVYSGSGKNKATNALFVLTERLTRKEIIMAIPNRKAESVVRALNWQERRMGAENFRRIFKTITFDNGTEFADTAGIERSVLVPGPRTKVYYCHPYSSFERGSNENANKMIRRRYPKGTNFARVGADEIAELENWMNRYPRKIHGYTSAEELFKQCVQALA